MLDVDKTNVPIFPILLLSTLPTRAVTFLFLLV